jgi:hypothetical protein
VTSKGRWGARIVLSAACLLPLAAQPKAHTFKTDYQAPSTGVPVQVSAPDPTSTPIIIEIIVDGEIRTAAVLARNWWRYKAIVADGTRHPKIAQNPKAEPLPWEAEFLVPANQRISLIARSHGELVGSNIRTCKVPFVFEARAGFRYSAQWQVTKEGCRFGVLERPVEPADAPAVPLTSLESSPKS